jgi:hypothetical protein
MLCVRVCVYDGVAVSFLLFRYVHVAMLDRFLSRTRFLSFVEVDKLSLALLKMAC